MMSRMLFQPPMNGRRSEMDRLVDAMLPEAFSWVGGRDSVGRKAPPLNIWEDDRTVYIEAELPGMRDEDIEVTVLNRVLTIAGQRTIQVPNGANVVHRERNDMRFERSIRLPDGIDDQQIEAAMRNGVLTLTLLRSPQSQPRRINVRFGNGNTTASAEPASEEIAAGTSDEK